MQPRFILFGNTLDAVSKLLAFCLLDSFVPKEDLKPWKDKWFAPRAQPRLTASLYGSLLLP